jgi:MFS family permease
VDRPHGDWRPVAVFLAANVLVGAGLYFHAFLYNFYLQELGHGEAVMGVAAAAISAGGLAALIPAGLAVDRLGIRTAYIGAVMIAALGLGMGAFAERPLPIYFAAALAGAGTAAWRVAMGPAIMRLATDRIRTRTFSWNTALLVGSGAAWTGGAGAAAAALQGWGGMDRGQGLRVTLLIGALATASAAVLLPLALRSAALGAPAAGRAGSTMSGWRSRLGALAIPRAVALFIIAVGLCWTAGALALPFYNIYFQREHGLDIAGIGFILGLGQALTAGAVFASGEGAARVGPRRVLAIWLLLLPPALWGLAIAGGTGIAITFFLLQAFILPAIYPLVDQLVLERAAPDHHGAVSGWRNVATEGSGLIGATLGGYLLAALSFDLLFGLAGAIALAGVASTLLLLRGRSPD